MIGKDERAVLFPSLYLDRSPHIQTKYVKFLSRLKVVFEPEGEVEQVPDSVAHDIRL